MAKERRSLNGKVVAITGGARGIGKATAEALVAKGCRVAIGDLDLTLAEQTAGCLGGGTVALALDVTDRASFERFLDEAERQLGPIDVVVNNAGIMPVTPFAEEGEDSVRRQVEINLLRRDHRHPAGDRADDPPPRWPHRQHRLPGGQSRDSGNRHLLGDQARGGRVERGGARRASRQRDRGRLRDADVVNTELTERRRPALGQTGRGGRRGRRDRRRARSPAL